MLQENKNSDEKESKNIIPDYSSSKRTPIYEKILNIDDHLSIVNLISSTLDFLSVHPINTINFTECSKCIKYCEKNSLNIDLIMTGYHMPEYNGIDLLKIIDPFFNKKIPVIMHSGMDPQLLQEFSIEKDFYNLELNNIVPLSFLPKPLPFEDINNLLFFSK